MKGYIGGWIAAAQIYLPVIIGIIAVLLILAGVGFVIGPMEQR